MRRASVKMDLRWPRSAAASTLNTCLCLPPDATSLALKPIAIRPTPSAGHLPRSISRGFVPWRLSDDGPGASGTISMAVIRNPSQQRTLAIVAAASLSVGLMSTRPSERVVEVQRQPQTRRPRFHQQTHRRPRRLFQLLPCQLLPCHWTSSINPSRASARLASIGIASASPGGSARPMPTTAAPHRMPRIIARRLS
jgi:hypothetical protein